MPPAKGDVPGPMVEDGPPAQVAVEDVALVLEDPQESQSMGALEARSRIFNCQLQFSSSELKSSKECNVIINNKCNKLL